MNVKEKSYEADGKVENTALPSRRVFNFPTATAATNRWKASTFTQLERINLVAPSEE
jgi:hypothetical protein